jgi:hypothetical protein
MSGWRKRQIQERESMNFTSDDPNYGSIQYTINPNIDLSKVTITTKIRDYLIDDLLIENYLELGDFTEANAIIDGIRNDR